MAGDLPSDPRRAWFRLVDVGGSVVDGIGVIKAGVVIGNSEYPIEIEETVVSEE